MSTITKVEVTYRAANKYYRRVHAATRAVSYQATKLKLSARTQSVNLTVQHFSVPTGKAANGRIQSWSDRDVAPVLLCVVVCLLESVQLSAARVRNGKERAGTSVHYMNGNTVSAAYGVKMGCGLWAVHMVSSSRLQCRDGRHRVTRD